MESKQAKVRQTNNNGKLKGIVEKSDGEEERELYWSSHVNGKRRIKKV